MGSADNVALILIDLQNSFVFGKWRNYFGDGDVTKIKSTFNRCASLLQDLPPQIPVLLTQVPFHNPDDFEFYGAVGKFVHERRYRSVIKPCNDIMEAEGIEEWMQDIIKKKISSVIIGGCVTTSCIRVSSINLLKRYQNTPDRPTFIVDLNLCAARVQNYVLRCPMCMDKYLQDGCSYLCGQCESSGLPLESPVDRAVSDMKKSGLVVVDSYDWVPILQKGKK